MAEFEEDADLTTASAPRATAHAAHLTEWREQPLVASATVSASGVSGGVAYLAWAARSPHQAPSYTITLPSSLAGEWRLNGVSQLMLSLAPIGEATGLDCCRPTPYPWLPVASFVQANPAFDPARLDTIRLLFDPPSGGAVLLDQIGFATGA